MRPLLVSLIFLIACAKPQAENIDPTAPGLPVTPGVCKTLKSLWTSESDSEVHDWRGLGFTFLWVPYSYVGTNGAACSQQAKFFMFTPEVSGASFEFDLQNSPGAGCSNGTFYIRYFCTQIQICNSNFTSCKAFQ